MSAPVCGCLRGTMRVEEIGVTVLQRAQIGDYKLYQADILRCPECKARLFRLAEGYVAHHQPEFDRERAAAEQDGTLYVWESEP